MPFKYKSNGIFNYFSKENVKLLESYGGQYVEPLPHNFETEEQYNEAYIVWIKKVDKCLCKIRQAVGGEYHHIPLQAFKDGGYIIIEKNKTLIDLDKVTMGDLYSYKNLSKYVGLIGKIPCRADTTFVGVEIELEGVEENSVPHGVWDRKEDGSLKDHGMEYVTIPIQFKYLEVELERLFNGLKSFKVTSRCSTHVHLNARDLTINEYKVFILLYLIFEKSLYNVSGKRWKNNFCVPLRTSLETVRNYFQKINTNSIEDGKWYKYFGLNISPLFGGESQRLGTIEFRHLEGCTDIKRIISWINLIISLKITAKKIKYIDMLAYLEVMNTDSSYQWLTEITFKEYGIQIFEQPTYKEDVEQGVSIAKTILHAPKKSTSEISLPLSR
jgi:hypothetical protein